MSGNRNPCAVVGYFPAREELTGALLVGGDTGRGHRRRCGLTRVTGNGHNSSTEGKVRDEGRAVPGHRSPVTGHRSPVTASSAQFELGGPQIFFRVSGAERSC